MRQGCFFFVREEGATLQRLIFKWSQPVLSKSERNYSMELFPIEKCLEGESEFVCERRLCGR